MYVTEGDAAPKAKRERNTTPTSITFYKLINHAADGRTDRRAQKEKITFLDYTDDQTVWQAAVKAAMGVHGQVARGMYLADITDADNCFVRAVPFEVIEDGQPHPAAAPAGTAAPAVHNPSPVDVLNTTLGTMRVAKEIVKESQPETRGPAVTHEDVRGIVRDSLADVLQALKQPPARPPSLAEQLGELADVRESLGTLFGVQPPAQTQQADPADSFLSQYEKFVSIGERINPNGAERGWAEKIGAAAEGLGRGFGAVAPHVGPILRMLLASRAGAAQQGDAGQTAGAAGLTQQPAQAAASALPPPLDSLFPILIPDCTRDASPERTADVLESILKAQPDYAPMLQDLMSMPSVAIVQTVAQLSGAHYLIDLPHSVSWVEGLKDEIRERGEEDAEGEAAAESAPAAASLNGHGKGGAQTVAAS
jgi:hypothetical protein